MSNACTVAIRTPCLGLRTFLSAPKVAAHQCIPNAILFRNCSRIPTLRRSIPNESRFHSRSCETARFAAIRSFTQQACRRAKLLAGASAFPKGPRKGPIKKPEVVKSAWWKKYRPEDGIPLAGGELSQSQINSILGPGIDVKPGNRLLCVLQYRRVSGTLEDEETPFPQELKVAGQRRAKGLAYLRAKYPVDERAAADAWAEEEARRLEKQLMDDADLINSYMPQQGKSEHARSHLQEMFKRRKQQLIEEEKRKAAEEREQQHLTGTLQTGGRPGELAKREKPEWVKYYEDRAVITKEKVAPRMSTFRRLWPSTLFTMAVVGLCVLFAHVYTPPIRDARLWPDTPPAIATCAAILIANAAIFILWRLPPAWRLMNRAFVLVPGHPSAFAILGNVFSHQELWHFFMNMFLLMILGPRLHEDVGRGNFLAIYVGSGVIGSFASFTWNVLRRNFVTSTLGASGAIYGVVASLCLVNPSDSFSIIFWPEFRIPISSEMLLGFLIAFDLAALYSRKTKSDHMAHLGGYVTGISAAYALRNQAAERKRLVDEKKKQMGFMQSVSQPR